MRVPVTERGNPRSRALDRLSTLEILRVLNREDARVAAAVLRELPRVARVVDRAVEALRAGGRVFYVGAGTSGRLGALDAAECPPTFGVPRAWFQAVIAGGKSALHRAIEGAEDSSRAAVADLRRRRLSRRDLVVGLSASGETPYALAAIRHAKKVGAATAAVTCDPRSTLAGEASVAVAPRVGPEAIAGSTRLKAGTAQKLVLNMVSTATLVRLGRVRGNRMSHLRPASAKLRRRAVRIAADLLGLSSREAAARLRKTGFDLSRLLETGRAPNPTRRRS